MLVVFYFNVLCSVKKLKQEVLLDQSCLHLVKWSIKRHHGDIWWHHDDIWYCAP